MTIQRVSTERGAELFRQWGLVDWPDLDADYIVFDNSLVAAIVRQAGYVDVHMSGCPGHRHKARAFSTFIISLTQGIPIRLVIKKGNRAVNLARRLGFVSEGVRDINIINGGVTQCDVMWRF